MNIGDVSALSGLKPKTIRYYETRGLLRPLRSTNGYRSYRPSDARRLYLLAQARKIGLSLSDCETLLKVAEAGKEQSGTIAQLLEAHLGTLEQKIDELEQKKAAVTELLDKTALEGGGDQRLLSMLGENAMDNSYLAKTG